MRRGRRVRCGPVDVFLAESRSPRPRIGIVVPRFGHSVAARNRLQRRLREIARREWLPEALAAGTSWDAVVRTRPEAYGASFRELRGALLKAPCPPWRDD